jgi:hypothetical protein
MFSRIGLYVTEQKQNTGTVLEGDLRSGRVKREVGVMFLLATLWGQSSFSPPVFHTCPPRVHLLYQ